MKNELAKQEAGGRVAAGHRAWRGWACAIALGVLGGASSCAAVFPEIATPVRDVPAGIELDPPPPDDLLFLHVASADIPKRTRDGRQWDEVGGRAPDPFVVVFAENDELFRTEVQSNTLHPVWKEKPNVNYRIPPRAQIRVELWDKNTMQPRPICQAKFRDVQDAVFSGGRDISCSSGARIRLDVERAKAKMGIGMKLEVRSHQVFITRVYQESPASRAELKAGHEVVSIQGKAVAQMGEGEARSLINANTRTGVTLSVLDPGGGTLSVTLKDGPIYPVAGDGITLD